MNRKQCLAFLALAWLAGHLSQTQAAPLGSGPFDHAFRFATALVPADAVDGTKAQAKIVTDLAQSGALDAARRSADQITGWCRGAAYADLAVGYAEAGQREMATNLLAAAERIQADTRDWHATRVRAHIVQAQALMGDISLASEAARTLPAEEGERARPVTIRARVERGDFTGAMNELGRSETVQNFDVRVGVAAAYLAAARHPRLADQPERRRAALQGALRVAETLPLWKRLETVERAMDGLLQLADEGRAKQVVDTLAAALAKTADDEFKPRLLARLAVLRVRLKDQSAAAELLSEALHKLDALNSMDRPGARAEVAAAFVAAGQTAKAWELYRAALEEAAGFVNARPRALAIVEICRSLGRQRLELDEPMQQRLTALFNGLADPW